MATESTKKRKNSEDASSEAKKKKVDSDSSAGGPRSLKISRLLMPQVAPPVVAVAPGLTLSKATDFHPYDKVDAPTIKKRKKNAPPSEMLLHSTSHRSLDYTAQEDCRKGSQPLVRHFIGLFDPKTGKVEVIESKKMVVRGTVRAQKASDEAMKAKKTAFEMRTELGEAFGTKKAKKAIRAVTENAIMSAGAPGRMAQGDLALMDSIKGTTENMATREELEAVVEQARPVPRGNYDAEEIQDVYIPAEIIGAEILNSIPVMDWQDSVKAQEAISVPSRFVANRISRVAHNENAVERLRVMRYLLLVIIFWATTRQGRERGTRTIGKRDQLKSAMGGVPDMVVENIRRKFSDGGVMRKTHVDLLMTHCCVFASIIDNFEVNTLDLREDLKLEQKQLAQYFMEVGARMTQSKKGDKVDHIAKLALPLLFPKVRQVRARK